MRRKHLCSTIEDNIAYHIPCASVNFRALDALQLLWHLVRLQMFRLIYRGKDSACANCNKQCIHCRLIVNYWVIKIQLIYSYTNTYTHSYNANHPQLHTPSYAHPVIRDPSNPNPDWLQETNWTSATVAEKQIYVVACSIFPLWGKS